LPEPASNGLGWYSEVSWRHQRYLLGAICADANQEDGEREWVLAVVKHRTISEILLGRNKMTHDDACISEIRKLLEVEPAFFGVKLE